MHAEAYLPWRRRCRCWLPWRCCGDNSFKRGLIDDTRSLAARARTKIHYLRQYFVHMPPHLPPVDVFTSVSVFPQPRPRLPPQSATEHTTHGYARRAEFAPEHRCRRRLLSARGLRFAPSPPKTARPASRVFYAAFSAFLQQLQISSQKPRQKKRLPTSWGTPPGTTGRWGREFKIPTGAPHTCWCCPRAKRVAKPGCDSR